MPKKSQTIVSQGLNKMDMFVDPIQLNTEGEAASTSHFGGIVSAVVVLLLLAEFIIQMMEIGHRHNPTVIEMDEYSKDPLVLQLNSADNFIVAVMLTVANQNVNMSNNSLLSFTATYTGQTRSTSGVVTKTTRNIIWGPCTQDHFPKNVFGDSYTSNSLQYAYCPTGIDWTDPTTHVCPDDIKASYPDCIGPTNLQIQGTFLDPVFDYVNFKLLPTCDPAAAATVKGLTCTTESQTAVFAVSEVKFNLFYSNVLIDPLNYDSPNTTYLDSYYWRVNPSVIRITDIYIDGQTVQDYNDYFSTSKYRNRTFYNFGFQSAVDMQAFNRATMLEWNIRRSHTNILTVRKYSKVLDVVSNIGGLSKILLVVGAFIALGYNRYKHQMMLSNRLYDFQPLKKKLTKKQTSTLTTTKSIELTGKPKKHGLISKLTLSPKKKPASTTDEAIKDYFDVKTKNAQRLPYNELAYFKSLFSRLCCKVSDEEKLAMKAQEQIVRDLDIIKIVEKIKEIDKLKLLLLNKHQREAFDFIEKPLITLKDHKPQQRGSISLIEMQDTPDSPETPLNFEGPETPCSGKQESKALNPKEDKAFNPKEEYNSLSKYSRLYTAYLNLKKDSDPRNSKYNKKLLHMIGKELMEVFERVDEVMGDSIDPKRFEEVVQKIVSQPIVDESANILPIENAV